MSDALDITLLKLAGDRLPGGSGFELAVAERVNVQRLNVSAYRASAFAGAGALIMGIGASMLPAVSVANAQSLEPLAAMSMAPSTLLGGME